MSALDDLNKNMILNEAEKLVDNFAYELLWSKFRIEHPALASREDFVDLSMMENIDGVCSTQLLDQMQSARRTLVNSYYEKELEVLKLALSKLSKSVLQQ